MTVVSVKFKKELVTYDNEGPDGIKVGADGNIYAVVSNKILIYNPSGKLISQIKVPIQQGIVSNLCFGVGKYSKTLFITASKKLLMIELDNVVNASHNTYKN